MNDQNLDVFYVDKIARETSTGAQMRALVTKEIR